MHLLRKFAKIMIELNRIKIPGKLSVVTAYTLCGKKQPIFGLTLVSPGSYKYRVLRCRFYRLEQVVFDQRIM